MPYVHIPQISQQNRANLAARRWQSILEARPDLAPALELQKRLLGLISELAQVFEEGRLPRLSLPPKYLAAKLARGVPMLAGEPIPLPAAMLRPVIGRLCDALAEGGAGDAALHIRDALDKGAIEVGSLLTASLARDHAAVRTGATH